MPAWLDEFRFPRCLVDTGSEVNLISMRDVVKHGMQYEMGGIEAIRGFNGKTSPVDGLLRCKIRLGPCGEGKDAEFLVTSAVSIPIIGMPTLSDLEVMVDCRERLLQDNCGNVVKCSAASQMPKN